jgi:hypothetical protein
MSALKIQKNKEKIVKLLNENIDLEYNLDLKRYKRFSEDVKNIGSKKEPKEVKVKIGHWIEKCTDEGTGEVLKLERSMIIEIDGQKSDHWNKIKYYTVADV